MDTPTPPVQKSAARRRLGRGPLAGAAMAAILMGATALGAATLASAQDAPSTPTTVVEVDSTDEVEVEVGGAGDVHTHEHQHEGGSESHEHDDDWDHDHDWDIEISAEDEAVFDRFDACLAENGWTEEAFDALDKDEHDGADIDEATIDSIDAAFETCDPILEDLSPELQKLEKEWDEEWEDEDHEEFSVEDEALLERLEDCVVEGLGGDANKVDEMMEAREYGEAAAEEIAAVDAAIDGCSDILNQLSPDARAMVDDFLD